uniref:Uncharacterized protein n=1 Tax=Percolomonas cosmopolitus TaxID=63605 RepID=A0A7S1KRR3_9EUKA|mmetsp:Transcript_6807/g.25430  ORF Transcript_6807/g.25430 Transcript_6807/m.25430 type:complete len:308 (+) Transcript_6807:288-1211(+)
MTDPYSYDFEDDINPYDNATQLDDVDMTDGANSASAPPPPRNLPPPPTNTRSNSSPLSPPPGSSLSVNKPDTTSVARKPASRKKDPPKTQDLSGFREKKLFGFAFVGNLPFPLINPNYFTYLRWSGHWIIVPVAFFELFLVCAVLLFNLLGQWFFLGASLEISAGWAPYIALRLVWAHVIVCLMPCVVFSKYAAIFRACTERDPLVKAPLYLLFVIFTILTTLFYVAMWTGGIGSGLFSSIFFLIGGLVAPGGPKIYTIVVAGFELFVSVGWLLLIICSVIEVGGMARNWYLYKKARKEAKAAMNAV